MIRRYRLTVRTFPLQGRNTGSIPVSATMHPQHKEAINLRLKGRSYNEIARALDVSKGSLSLWFKDLKLPKASQKLLEEKMKIALEHNLFENNRRRTRNIQIENRKIRQSAKIDIKALSKYELKLMGIALYWAEGWNRDNTGKGHGMCFSNSNPDMVKLFLKFLREIIKVPEDKLRVDIHIYPSINEKSAIRFWSNVTNIPKQRFRITQQISRASKGKRPKNSLPYGTLKLDVGKRQNFFKIQGWIDGLIKQNS